MASDGDRYIGRNTIEYNMGDPAYIECIEITKEAVSSVYNSDAIAVVVNIVNRWSTADPFPPFTLMLTIRKKG